jgi:diadenylate cyclase
MHGISLSVLRRGLRWQDAVDVLLLTLIFSRLYASLRRTVAVQIAFGLLTLAAAWWVASHLGLILTSYLLSAVGAVATVVVVVVFQHEIRQGLSRVSLLRWLTRRRDPRSVVGGRAGAATAISEAAFALAGCRKGGLIVIPRGDSVYEHVTAGTVIDARLSPSLLEAIFTSTSPLHDGAAIVIGDRLARAAVVLPLATEATDRGLGTRHRAALGLTSTCDALVVCISEERGVVCLAHEGALEGVASEAELTRALARLGVGRIRETGATGRGARAGRWWPRAADLWPHLAIFSAVFVAWAVMALDRSHAVARIVPLEIRGVGDAIAFDPPRFTSIAVELRGSRRELEILPPDAVGAYLDLSGATAGPHVYRVLTSTPAGIEVVSTLPSSVPIQVRPRGAPPPLPAPLAGSGVGPNPRGRPPASRR